MKRTAFLTAGIAAGFLLLAPGMALAATGPGTPHPSPTATPVPTTTTPSDDEAGVWHSRITKLLTVTPAKAHPGDRVALDFHCQTRGPDEKVSLQSAALEFAPLDKAASGKVKDVKPGKYAVTLHCGPEDSTAYLEVLAKKQQVEKVPAGAPQTGGTDGPVEPSSNPAPAAAMGALALGGIGLAAAQRRRSRRQQG